MWMAPEEWQHGQGLPASISARMHTANGAHIHTTNA